MSTLNLNSPEHSPLFFQQFKQALSEETKQALLRLVDQDSSLLTRLQKLLLCSQYACTEIAQRPELLVDILARWQCQHPMSEQDYAKQFNTHFHTPEDDASLNQQLRRLRKQVLLRILWRDINQLNSLQETTAELSFFAEHCLQQALSWHYEALIARFGEPQNHAGEKQAFIVLGMGKLGARELNLSSDIDLIFCYPEKGVCTGKDALENQAFFNHLGKKIIYSLDHKNADGFVFRVDMRLRPYGQSGALVSNYSALEDYYQNQGREWERYAMVKARVVASNGGSAEHAELTQILNNFTYRKYIDFSVIDALRKLKNTIRQEVRRRKLDDDIKLGSGGIREIEFITQAFQLIRGGRETELQDNRLAYTLPLLEQKQCLPEGTAQKLLDAYQFLRHSEHAIQGFNDEQTQKLPRSAHGQTALAIAMSFDTWPAYLTKLEHHRDIVRTEFEAVIASPKNDTDDQYESGAELWFRATQTPESCDPTSALSCEELNHFAHWPTIQKLGVVSRERLDQFMPILLSELQTRPHGQSILTALLPLIQAIVRRSAYIVLLIENPTALHQLIDLCEASPQIADALTKHPALLDELLDVANLYTLPEKQDLAAELRRSMLRVEEHDLEQQMESLRYFKLSHSLRIAACEVSGALPLMKVSDYLTRLAEVILDYCLQLVWNTLIAKHGYPDGKHSDQPDFLIVGYGKLGGIEMNHGSDLDLVFIYDTSITGQTDGEKPLENQVFYVRLGQKLIHILNTQTASGRLYEVDMRLRPSGNSGLLATSLNAYKKYQENNAWTWEHQALVRARPIAGSTTLASNFAQLRKNIILKQRDLEQLAKDIVNMRVKMREHLGSKNKENSVFDIKQDTGGIVDIEFMVQYLVLAWSHAEPALAAYTDNIRILEALAHTDKLSAQEVDQLIAAYKALRVVLHRLTIEQKPNSIGSEELIGERDSVKTIWCRLFAAAGDA